MAGMPPVIVSSQPQPVILAYHQIQQPPPTPTVVQAGPTPKVENAPFVQQVNTIVAGPQQHSIAVPVVQPTAPPAPPPVQSTPMVPPGYKPKDQWMPIPTIQANCPPGLEYCKTK